MRALLIVVGLAIAVAYPIVDDAQAEVAAIESATANAKKYSKDGVVLDRKAVFEQQVLHQLETNEQDGNLEAAKVAKLAEDIPKEWGASKSLPKEMKASERVASTLMHMKHDMQKEEEDAISGEGDAKKLAMAAPDAELGEAKRSTLEQARSHAKMWLEGQKLAKRERQLEKAEKGENAEMEQKETKMLRNAQHLVKSSLRAESQDLKQAKKMANEIDGAGATLNKWYDQMKASAQPSFPKTKALYKKSHRLGEAHEPVNAAQEAIKKRAMATIKQVAARAKKAISAAMKAANTGMAGTSTSKPVKSTNADTMKTRVNQAGQILFGTMKTRVNQVAGPSGVGREASAMAATQDTLAIEDKSYETP